MMYKSYNIIGFWSEKYSVYVGIQASALESCDCECKFDDWQRFLHSFNYSSRRVDYCSIIVLLETFIIHCITDSFERIFESNYIQVRHCCNAQGESILKVNFANSWKRMTWLIVEQLRGWPLPHQYTSKLCLSWKWPFKWFRAVDLPCLSHSSEAPCRRRGSICCHLFRAPSILRCQDVVRVCINVMYLDLFPLSLKNFHV